MAPVLLRRISIHLGVETTNILWPVNGKRFMLADVDELKYFVCVHFHNLCTFPAVVLHLWFFAGVLVSAKKTLLFCLAFKNTDGMPIKWVSFLFHNLTAIPLRIWGRLL